MLPTIALLCLLTAPTLVTSARGIEVKFDGDVSRIGITAYFDMLPQSEVADDAAGRLSPGPARPTDTGRKTSALVMWCPRDGRSPCVLTDEAGNIVGRQTGLDMKLYADWRNRGFTDWPIQMNGITKNYWPAQQYQVASALLGGNQTPPRQPSRLPDNANLEPNFTALLGGNQAPSRQPNPQPDNANLEPNFTAFLGGNTAPPRQPSRQPDNTNVQPNFTAFLAMEQANRPPTRRPDSQLQDSGNSILQSGFGGERPQSSLGTNVRDVNDGRDDQRCIPRKMRHQRGLIARFDGDVTRVGRSAYFDLPQSAFDAATEGWVQVPRPEGPAEMASLVMWCPRNDYTVCIFTDDTGYIAGTQTAMDENLFTDAILDWRTQGYTYWSVQVNGVQKNYWTAQQYFITPALLATDPATRIARRNPDTLLQDSSILVSGINGELFSITTNACDITSGRTRFTRQACLDKMGEHYAYRLSNSTSCEADQILSWLPLIDNNQLIGVTMVMYSKHTTPEEGRKWFEILDNALLKVAVPNGPDCLYDLPDKSGLVTLHTYYIKRPYDIRC